MLSLFSRFQSPRFIFEMGRKAASFQLLGLAITLYVSALQKCIERRESPLLHSSDEILDCMYNPDEKRRPYWPLLLRLVAHELLANDLINYTHDFENSYRVMVRRRNIQRTRSECSSTLYLSDDWTRNIGHIGVLGSLIKLKELGVVPWKEIVIVAKKQRVANAPFLEQLSPYIHWVSDQKEVLHLEPSTILSGFRITSVIEGLASTPISLTGEMEYFADVEWRKAGRSALLSLTELQHKKAQSLLAALGLPRDAWFVCLHVREKSFHVAGTTQGHRNANITDYIAALEAIAARGGWVVRMGDPKMSPAPLHPRIIDWAHSRLRTAEGDVLLTGSCRFAIASNSGFVYLPYCFGRPILLANAPITPGTAPFGPQCILLPKLIRHGGRLLSFKELFSPEWQRAVYSTCGMEALGAQCIDNTPDEIAKATEEMLYDGPCNGDLDSYHGLTDLQRCGMARISRYFLKKHSELV